LLFSISKNLIICAVINKNNNGFRVEQYTI